MSDIQFLEAARLQTLPSNPSPNTIYFIKAVGKDSGEIYVTNNDGTIVAEMMGRQGLQGPAGDGFTYRGEAVPLNTFGSDGESFYNELTADTFKKEGGIWVFKANIKGEAGADGLDGLDGRDGLSAFGTSPENLYIPEDGLDDTRLFAGSTTTGAQVGSHVTALIEITAGDKLFARGAEIFRSIYTNAAGDTLIEDGGGFIPTIAPVGAERVRFQIAMEAKDRFEFSIGNSIGKRGVGGRSIQGVDSFDVRNLVDKDDFNEGVLVRTSSFSIDEISTFSMSRTIIPIQENLEYVVNRPVRIYFMDTDTNSLVGTVGDSTFVKTGNAEEPFTTPANTNGILLSCETSDLEELTIARADVPALASPRSSQAIDLNSRYFITVQKKCWTGFNVIYDGDSQFGPVFNSNFDKMPRYITELTGGTTYNDFSEGGRAIAIRASEPNNSIVESIENWDVLPNAIYLVCAGRADALSSSGTPLGTQTDEDNKVQTTYRGAMKRIADRFTERMNGNGSILMFVGTFPDSSVTNDIIYEEHAKRILEAEGHRFFSVYDNPAWPWEAISKDPHNIYIDTGHIAPGYLHYAANYLVENYLRYHTPIYATSDRFYK